MSNPTPIGEYQDFLAATGPPFIPGARSPMDEEAKQVLLYEWMLGLQDDSHKAICPLCAALAEAEEPDA
jgi:hypothetical protein